MVILSEEAIAECEKILKIKGLPRELFIATQRSNEQSGELIYMVSDPNVPDDFNTPLVILRELGEAGVIGFEGTTHIKLTIIPEKIRQFLIRQPKKRYAYLSPKAKDLATRMVEANLPWSFSMLVWTAGGGQPQLHDKSIQFKFSKEDLSLLNQLEEYGLIRQEKGSDNGSYQLIINLTPKLMDAVKHNFEQLEELPVSTGQNFNVYGGQVGITQNGNITQVQNINIPTIASDLAKLLKDMGVDDPELIKLLGEIEANPEKADKPTLTLIILKAFEIISNTSSTATTLFSIYKMFEAIRPILGL